MTGGLRVTYTTIDDPLGTTTSLDDINDRGQIVGTYYDSKDVQQSFVYFKGQFTPIGDPNATGGTQALGINDNGQIVGSYFDKGTWHGFLYKHGKYSTLDDPLGTSTQANGINDNGQIVGNYTYDHMGDQHGFLYKNGHFATLEDPFGPTSTGALGINDSLASDNPTINPSAVCSGVAKRGRIRKSDQHVRSPYV